MRQWTAVRGYALILCLSGLERRRSAMILKDMINEDTYFLLSPQICFADGGPGNRVDRGAAKCCQRLIDESHPCWFRKSGWGSLMSVAIVFVV